MPVLVQHMQWYIIIRFIFVKKHLKATLLLENILKSEFSIEIIEFVRNICKCKADAAMMVGRISNQRETFNFKKLFPHGEPL